MDGTRLNLVGLAGEREKEQNTQHGIAVRPVLLRKGKTRLGLYGIGNVKDARMHFELRSNRVRMFMPQDKEEWFNLMLLHQNRCPFTKITIAGDVGN